MSGGRRSQLLYVLFVIALAAGFVTAQYLYIWAQDVDPDDDAAPSRQRQLVRPLLHAAAPSPSQQHLFLPTARPM